MQTKKTVKLNFAKHLLFIDGNNEKVFAENVDLVGPILDTIVSRRRGGLLTGIRHFVISSGQLLIEKGIKNMRFFQDLLRDFVDTEPSITMRIYKEKTHLM